MPSDLNFSTFELAIALRLSVFADQDLGIREVLVRGHLEVVRCRLVLEDDGCGFDVNTASRYGGYGLKTIRERLQRIGGTLTVRSEPGAGSTLEIEVPL